MPRKRRSKPKPKNETTVVGSQLISWALPGGKGGSFEMLSPDDLLTRHGWSAYREMENDDQVKACLWYKKTLLSARPFDMKPASDNQQDKDIAEFVKKNLDAVNFKRIIWEMLSAFEFGFSTGEILWKIDDLKLKLKGVKFRDPEFMFIQTDRHGNIEKFVQRPSQPIVDPAQHELFIEPEKILHYAYQRKFSNHTGVSDLRAAYRAWWSKKYVTQFWNVFLERFGAPLMKMTYPQGASEGLKTDLKNIMLNLSSKTDILVPDGVVIDLIEATRSGQANYDGALTYFDVRIATSILIPALLGMGVDTKRGSDSQSRLHLRTLMKVIQYIGCELVEEIQHKIIKPIVDANWEVKEYPEFIFQDYGEFEAFEITDAIKELFNAGILDMDQEDVNFARSVLGMQIRNEDNEDEIRRPDPSMLPVAPGGNAQADGGGAGQSNDRATKGVSTRKTDSRTGQQRPNRRK